MKILPKFRDEGKILCLKGMLFSIFLIFYETRKYEGN